MAERFKEEVTFYPGTIANVFQIVDNNSLFLNIEFAVALSTNALLGKNSKPLISVEEIENSSWSGVAEIMQKRLKVFDVSFVEQYQHGEKHFGTGFLFQPK